MRYEKFAPGLSSLLDDYKTEGPRALALHAKTLGIMHVEGVRKPPHTVVFIHCKAEARLGHLADYGIRVNSEKGGVRTAYVPLESLERLSEEPTVERIIPSHFLKPLMDVATGKVNVPALRNQTSGGKGVIVGIVDTGIDSKHPAFTGRIVKVWDQTLSGRGVKEGDYGVEMAGNQAGTSQDTEGHGTHVAGIAAGNDPTYMGIAPEAELLIVKSDLQDTHIADGIRYIFRIAGDVGRPAVVNLSLGGHFDAHDGTDSLSQTIDDESGPGKIVCCAAGNEGNDNIHARATVNPGSKSSSRFRVPTGTLGMVLLNGWYPGTETMAIAIRTPQGFATPFQTVIPVGRFERDYRLPNAIVRLATPGPDPANHDHNFLVQIRGNPAGSLVAGGVWQLLMHNVLASSSRADVWIIDDKGGTEATFSGTSVSDSMKVGSPGAAESGVTVASYTTKVQWTDINHQTESVYLKLDDISDFSSEGPLRNGAHKPDLTTPGAMIVSCLSSHSSPSRQSIVNSQFVTMAGTSMATPFAAGIVALLLERKPKLDSTGVKKIIAANSSIPGKPKGAFDPKWGYGLVNAGHI